MQGRSEWCIRFPLVSSLPSPPDSSVSLAVTFAGCSSRVGRGRRTARSPRSGGLLTTRFCGAHDSHQHTPIDSSSTTDRITLRLEQTRSRRLRALDSLRIGLRLGVGESLRQWLRRGAEMRRVAPVSVSPSLSLRLRVRVW